jgi:hypothetical protein
MCSDFASSNYVSLSGNTFFGNNRIWIGHGNINSLDFGGSVSAFLRASYLKFN